MNARTILAVTTDCVWKILLEALIVSVSKVSLGNFVRSTLMIALTFLVKTVACV